MRTMLLLAAVAALFVAGCGSDDQSGRSGSEGTATATAAQTATATATEEGDNGEEAGGGQAKPCSEAGDIEGEPKAELPADVPLPGDWHVYASEGPFGKTMRYFAVTDGGPEDLPQRRDDASDILVENGYKLLSKDQEEGAEAEAHVNGKHTVDIQVIGLCEGKLRIRYTVS